ncbi:MAG: hypothetical protein A2341_22090 [Deltaproteobacteria bacterium RIFOXYB12_FULL_58_9]|nr:MAG: hypothetical protein A2341_22090 [Deltaproteobacteria bacterium RIFOXYB12_FULL_58_9]
MISIAKVMQTLKTLTFLAALLLCLPAAAAQQPTAVPEGEPIAPEPVGNAPVQPIKPIKTPDVSGLWTVGRCVSGLWTVGRCVPLRIGMQAHLRYLVDDTEPYHQLVVKRARLAVDLYPTPWLRAQVDVDVSELSVLKDAWVEVEPSAWLKLRAGQLKKPFSRVEATSSRQLPLCERGIVNHHIIDDNNLEFGGRDLGIVANGRFGDLRISGGVFNGNGLFQENDSGKDFVVRPTYEFGKFLEVGASGTVKMRSDEADPAYSAGGFDARVRLGPMEAVLEGLWAQDGRDRSDVLGVIGYVQLRYRVSDAVRLRPIVKAEFLNEGLGKEDNVAMAYMAGVNLHIAKVLRIMLQVEQVVAQSQCRTPNERRGMLQLAFDHRMDIHTD